MKTRALFFPFDLFGSGGTRQGAELLADAFQEMLADNRRERTPTRARAYTNKVRFEEFSFETLSAYTTWHEDARQAVHEVWQDGDFLLWITGNHLGVLPLVRRTGHTAAGTWSFSSTPIWTFTILAIARRSCRTATFCCTPKGRLPGIINVGHRELLLRPEYIRRFYQADFPPANWRSIRPPPWPRCGKRVRRPIAVFVDIDCDVFDPAYFPGAAHPLPFGINPHLLLRFLDAIWSDKLAGLSLSEFDPARDVLDRSLATLVWLLEYVLLKRHEKGG